MSGPARLGAWLWAMQRGSAVVLGGCVLVHLVTIVLATRAGLSAEAILARTRGSTGWFGFYLVFVAALAVHAPIGLRAIAAEWLGWRGRMLEALTGAAALALLAGGLRAIWGVFR